MLVSSMRVIHNTPSARLAVRQRLHTYLDPGHTRPAMRAVTHRTAERFRKAMNDTPLNYLRTVRIQNAMRLFE